MASADSRFTPALLAAKPQCAAGTAESGGNEVDSAARLRAMFGAHYASIWRLLRRLGVKEAQLDDASQEVFWVAARRLNDIRPGCEHAFLYGVALRVASNCARRHSSLPPTASWEQVSALVATEPNPEETLEQRRAVELLYQVLDRLPLELRSVFVLFELEGLQVRDIAELENIPKGTVGSRLRRAREEFTASAKRMRSAMSAGRLADD